MIVRECAEPGCETLVVGGYCLEHEAPQARVFVRGRPFVEMERSPTPSGGGSRAMNAAMSSSSFSLPVGDRVAPGFTKAGGRLPASS